MDDELDWLVPAEWAAMDQDQDPASCCDIPDWLLAAAPEDELPEQIRTAWQQAEA